MEYVWYSGVFWIGVGVGGGVGVIGGGGGVDASEGPEGGAVEQGLGVGGCSGAGVGGENNVGCDVNCRRTSENICLACCRTGVGGSTGGSPKL